MMKINYLLDSIDNGQVVLPEFQRGYVWSRDQVKGLFQSLYQKFPIGGLLIWNTSADATSLRGTDIRGTQTVKLLLDGQQRVTSLYGVMRGRPPRFFEDARKSRSFTGLYFNVEQEVFEFYRPTTMATDPLWISVSDLFLTGTEEALKNLGTVEPAQLVKYMSRITRIHSIGERELHDENIAGEHMTVDVVVDVFNRVNSGGTKLSKGDLALARICAIREEARAEIREALEQWSAAGYHFKSDWLLRTVNMVGTGEALFEALRGISSEDFGMAFKKATQSVDFLLNLLSSRLGVDHDKVLQGKYGLAVLARLVAERGGQVTDPVLQNKMLYWYLHQSMWGRYSGSTESTLNQDLEALDEGGIDGLIALMERARGSLRVRPEDFDTHSMGSRFYPILYILTRMNDSLDLCSGLKLSHHLLGRNTNLEVHHIFPKSVLYEHGYTRSQANAIANFTFLTGDCNKTISNKWPDVYLPTIQGERPEALETHWITGDRTLWNLSEYPNFLADRRQRLADALNEILDGLLAGTSPATMVGGAGVFGDDDGEAGLVVLAQRCDDLGLARPAINEPVIDDVTGDPLVYADAVWSSGMQEGMSEPVALLLEPDRESEEQLGELGYRFFTSMQSLNHYMEVLLNLDLDGDGSVGEPVEATARVAPITLASMTPVVDEPGARPNAMMATAPGSTVVSTQASPTVDDYPDYDFPIPRTFADLEEIADGGGRWRRQNRDAASGLRLSHGWAKPNGVWSHRVRAKVFSILLRYLPEGLSDVDARVLDEVEAQRYTAVLPRQSFLLTGGLHRLEELRALGHLLLRARDDAWAKGDRQGAYFLALYGGRALIHADEIEREHR
jgi:hypothetical protein